MAHGHQNTRHQFGTPSGRLPASGTRVSFVLSAALHALLLLLIGMTGMQQAGERIELTEVTYLEERYGAEVAKKVTIAPEKVEAARKRVEPKLEGSIFAKAKPPARPREMPGPLLGAAMAPLPVPKAQAPAAPAPASRPRTSCWPAAWRTRPPAGPAPRPWTWRARCWWAGGTTPPRRCHSPWRRTTAPWRARA
jgi:hypothetical protein